MLMHKILQDHLLCAFVANLKVGAIYPEGFCDKNLAIGKVFAFSDSETTWRQLGRDNRNDILVQLQIGSYTIFVVSRLLLGKARIFCTRNLFLFSAIFDENIRRSLLLHHDRHGGGGVQVGLELLLRGLQRQLSCQHSHHCQLWVRALSYLVIKKNMMVNFNWTRSLITSSNEAKVMLGVYTIIGLSFAPNAFEYYQVSFCWNHFESITCL